MTAAPSDLKKNGAAMPNRLALSLTSLLTLAATLALPARGSTAELTAQEIEGCVLHNVPQRSSEQTVTLRVVDREGDALESKARIFWRLRDDGKDIMVRFEEPTNRRGWAVLANQIGDDVNLNMYLPAQRRPRRILSDSLQGVMFETDLTYEDFLRLMNLAITGVVTKRAGDGKVDGRDVYVLDATPAPDGHSAYGRVSTMIDKERCVVVRMEMFGPDGKLAKLVTTRPDKITKESFGWLSREVKVEDVAKGSATVLVVDDFKADVAIEDGVFDLALLGQRSF